ncbi:hypothetical protein ODZ84_04865 [Chryseobacterium fluminis]|uniref:hypothetical protein n=1 Tax=Chryseobacterium fluminis TaxID=2983606 RepID=UPI0022586809|nr:hypothetical protein [Chryseobacterium sp. MMS21-Ot14]UZT98907.1 hypothetical protein ODZ84_04865 [Chryseobacterium sp. MMS21-Ot14]
MKKSIENLKSKNLGGFTRAFGAKIKGGGENTTTLAELVITVHSNGTKSISTIGEDHSDGCDANC